MTHEIWNGIPGSAVSDFISSPHFTQPADSFSTFAGASTPQDLGDHFASRIRGYITAPITGTYTFWAAGDDKVDLFISPSASKYDKKLIVQPLVVNRNFDADLSTKSRPINLIARQKYYLELRDFDNYWINFCEAAWQIPGGQREIIPTSALSTYTITADDLDDDYLPDAWELANGLDPADNRPAYRYRLTRVQKPSS